MGVAAQVLVVDDDDVVRSSYRSIIHHLDGFEVCGEAATGLAGVERYEELRPDLVLMDIQMPRMSGIEATAEICRRWPLACIVVITAFGTADHVVAALRAGASGYLLKDATSDLLRTGMRQALDGEMPLSGPVRRELVASMVAKGAPPLARSVPALTPRELELLQWLAHGVTNQQIAEQMHLSTGSVKQYMSNVGAKLGARSRTQILITALRLRLVDPDAAGR
ncbi:response regulator [Blastococcus sp. SYSU DS0619]